MVKVYLKRNRSFIERCKFNQEKIKKLSRSKGLIKNKYRFCQHVVV